MGCMGNPGRATISVALAIIFWQYAGIGVGAATAVGLALGWACVALRPDRALERVGRERELTDEEFLLLLDID